MRTKRLIFAAALATLCIATSVNADYLCGTINGKKSCVGDNAPQENQMNATQKDNLNLQLEQFVDAHGLKHVIDALSEVCQDKATHIAENWQDVALAKLWHKRGDDLAKVATQFGDE